MSRLYQTGGCTYDRRLHEIFECPWIVTARNQTHKKDLFTYYNRRTKTYVFALWVAKPKTGEGPGLFLELEILDDHPNRLGGSAVLNMDYVRARLQPISESLSDWDDRMAKQMEEEQAIENETEEERQDVAKYLASRGPKFAETAYRMRVGELEFAGMREAKHLREQMAGAFL